MLESTLQPFKNAAKPLEVMGNILSSWVIEKKATANQLDAWILARRSFLFNECQLMLTENEKIVVFLVLVMVILVAWQVIFVFVFGLFSCSLLVGIALSGFGGLTCIQAAVGCYEKQHKHRVQLHNLKEAVIFHDLQIAKKIDAITDNLGEQDYVTKLMFLPLNPKVMKGIVGYLATAAAAVLTKFVFAP
jgi:hypothetical protein